MSTESEEPRPRRNHIQVVNAAAAVVSAAAFTGGKHFVLYVSSICEAQTSMPDTELPDDLLRKLAVAADGAHASDDCTRSS